MQNKKRILVIDDELDVTDMLRDFLEANGFTVDTASDGLKGLACLKSFVPALVITDLLLPGEHGINIVKTIKEKYFLPVIIISSIYSEEELKDTMEEYFVEAFLDKPFDLNVLLETINIILNAKSR
ncbi:MAG: response regulator [bacterium]|nr:response regulator [bacterium]